MQEGDRARRDGAIGLQCDPVVVGRRGRGQNKKKPLTHLKGKRRDPRRHGLLMEVQAAGGLWAWSVWHVEMRRVASFQTINGGHHTHAKDSTPKISLLPE